MLRLPDSWVWDFWLADDGERFHLFFLYASRALHDPQARHNRASVGHAVSVDLVGWERVTDALVRSDAPAFDDMATWTGSVVRDDDGTWVMFYTGATLTPAGNVQAIGRATSSDLVTWTKDPGPVLEADPRWYELLADGRWHDQAFRDPWVFRHDGRWHMLVTARANHGTSGRGVVAHAESTDLRRWELTAPWSEPGLGFEQLEVVQTFERDGRHWLVFNCLAAELTPARRDAGATGGVWVAPAASPVGPYDLAAAYQLTGPEAYVGKLVVDRSGGLVLLAFANEGPDGFVGDILDPLPVVELDGRLSVVRANPA